MKRTASNLTKIAKNEVGYLEKKSKDSLNVKTANAGSKNYTKYSEVFGVNGVYWCCYFICWLFYTLCDNNKAKAKTMLCGCISGACETLRQAFVKAGRYYKTPKVGDLVFFTGTRHTGANHIAYIYKITATAIYTIEGNTSGASGVVDNGGGVAKKSYSKTNSRIMGYGRPYYEKEITNDNKEKSISEVAKEVIDGKWGSGSTRKAKLEAAGYDYKEIQAKVNEILKGKTTTSSAYYPKYTGNCYGVDTVLKAIGVESKFRGSWKNRKAIADVNGIKDYSGKSNQNMELIALAKKGKLKKM